MHILFTISLVVIGVLGWQLYVAKAAEHAPQPVAVDSAHSAREEMALKRMCADQAEKVHTKGGWSESLGGYESHYNSRLRTCFILMQHTLTNPLTITKSLFDAFEGSEYAYFLATPKKHGERYENDLMACWLGPPKEPKGACSLESEFDAFAAIYMVGRPYRDNPAFGPRIGPKLHETMFD